MVVSGQSNQPEIEYSLSLIEISRCCGVETEKILVLIAEGVLSPRGPNQAEWRFGSGDLGRALSALRLERDLGINPAGAALAIDLLDEMQQLRERVRLLEALAFER
jgi:chaperone modulatory protein CbpM